MRKLLLTFLFITNLSWAVTDSTCVTVEGDLLDCIGRLNALEDGVFKAFEDATQIHQFMMEKSHDYRVAYTKQSQNGDRSVELYLDGNGDLVVAHNGNGSTGGMIGKEGERSHNGNGSTGGMIGKENEKSHNGNGSTGGMIGKEGERSHNGNGSTGGMIGKKMVTHSHNGNGSTGGMIGKGGARSHNGNGSTGGMIGIIPASVDLVILDIDSTSHNGNGSTGGMIGDMPMELFHNGNGSTGGMIGDQAI